MTKSPLTRQIVVTFAVIGQLSFDFQLLSLISATKIADRYEILFFVMFGLLLGQLSLLAAYLAWGLSFWLLRWVNACFLLLAGWYLIVCGGGTGDIGSIEAPLAMFVALSFLLISIPYWALRAFCRSRFDMVREDQAPSAFAGPRNLILDRLTWGLLAAFLVVIVQSSVFQKLSEIRSISDGNLWEIAFWAAIWSFLNVLLAIPSLWVCLTRSNRMARFVSFGVYAIAASAIEWVLLRNVNDRMGSWVIGLNIGVLSETAVWSLLLRTFGYRFHMRPAIGVEPSAKPETSETAT